MSDASLLTLDDQESVISSNSHNSQYTIQSNVTGTTHSHSVVQRMCFSSQAPCGRLDSKLIVSVSNTWARVKRRDGYEEDLGEAIIIAMMDLEPKTREHLRIKSFRSSRFTEVCRAIADLIDMVVTLLGPDLDDEDLLEAGNRFREEGVDLKLFSVCISAGIQATLSKRHWTHEVESAWNKTFEMLLPSMSPA